MFRFPKCVRVRRGILLGVFAWLLIGAIRVAVILSSGHFHELECSFCVGKGFRGATTCIECGGLGSGWVLSGVGDALEGLPTEMRQRAGLMLVFGLATYAVSRGRCGASCCGPSTSRAARPRPRRGRAG